mgnify:CR=1 FL=1
MEMQYPRNWPEPRQKRQATRLAAPGNEQLPTARSVTPPSRRGPEYFSELGDEVRSIFPEITGNMGARRKEDSFAVSAAEEDTYFHFSASTALCYQRPCYVFWPNIFSRIFQNIDIFSDFGN